MIRSATLQDLDKLIALENEGFSSDRISRRSYRYLLTKGHAMIFVDSEVRSSCVILLRKGSSDARLYSLVVASVHQGKGLAKALFSHLENALRGYRTISLEVRADNHPAIKLYEKVGYKTFGRYESYYADKTPAIRMRKYLHD